MEQSESSQWQDFASNCFDCASISNLLLQCGLTNTRFSVVGDTNDTCQTVSGARVPFQRIVKVWCKIFVVMNVHRQIRAASKITRKSYVFRDTKWALQRLYRLWDVGHPSAFLTGLDPVFFYTCLAKGCAPCRILNTGHWISIHLLRPSVQFTAVPSLLRSLTLPDKPEWNRTELCFYIAQKAVYVSQRRIRDLLNIVAMVKLKEQQRFLRLTRAPEKLCVYSLASRGRPCISWEPYQSYVKSTNSSSFYVFLTALEVWPLSPPRYINIHYVYLSVILSPYFYAPVTAGETPSPLFHSGASC